MRLPPESWLPLRDAHEERARRWTDPHQARAQRGEKHPVYDFLFDYYAFRPAWLRRWHPGLGAVLTGSEAEAYTHFTGYHRVEGGVTVDPFHFPLQRRATVAWLHQLLQGMKQRPAFFGCFGLHEWAMVYQLTPAQIRHAQLPLRLSPESIARFVESQSLCCSHFDAFRFFTAPARPLNRLQPTREQAPALEQKGCLHANMDLYKWAFKLTPFTPSSLLLDCFALALEIRELDMRASPYDCSSLGFAPVPIETPEGRAAYEAAQREFSRRAEPLRDRLLTLTATLLEIWSAAPAVETERRQPTR